MGWFSSSKPEHDLPRGLMSRPKGGQKGVVKRDHQRGPVNFSEGANTRSWLFGAPAKHGKGK